MIQQLKDELFSPKSDKGNHSTRVRIRSMLYIYVFTTNSTLNAHEVGRRPGEGFKTGSRGWSLVVASKQGIDACHDNKETWTRGSGLRFLFPWSKLHGRETTPMATKQRSDKLQGKSPPIGGPRIFSKPVGSSRCPLVQVESPPIDPGSSYHPLEFPLHFRMS
jgi:hypothetical protein